MDNFEQKDKEVSEKTKAFVSAALSKKLSLSLSLLLYNGCELSTNGSIQVETISITLTIVAPQVSGS